MNKPGVCVREISYYLNYKIPVFHTTSSTLISELALKFFIQENRVVQSESGRATRQN